MSFLSTAFSGASNNFQPRGQQQAEAGYETANNGFNSLAEQLRQQMAGQGPNLANQQLQNTTGQNVSNQAALMAGQRGASANAGLMARQIGQQGAGIQQQAVGQAASNRLAQQLSAQQQLAGVYGQQGQLGANILNNNNQIGSQQAGQNAKMNQGILGGIAGAGASLLSLAEGGMPAQQPPQQAPVGWASNFVNGVKPQMMAQGGAANRLPFAPVTDYRQGGQVQAKDSSQKATVKGNSYANDKIPAMMSEGEVVLPREVTQSSNAPQAAAQFMAQVMAGKHRVKR